MHWDIGRYLKTEPTTGGSSHLLENFAGKVFWWQEEEDIKAPFTATILTR